MHVSTRRAVGVVSALAPRAAACWAARVFQTPRRLAGKPWEDEAERGAVRLDLGQGLSGLRWGQGGPRALLIHGWEGRATQFAAFVPDLLSRGYEVLAVDAPGHGRSRGNRANPFVFADALVRAQRAAGPAELVVGHSMGGAAALWACATQGLQAERLVTLAAPSELAWVVEGFVRYVGLAPAAGRAFERRLQRTVGVAAREVSADRVGAALADLPGLVIHDPQDAEISFAHAEALERAWPGARLLTVEGLGHRRVMRDRRVVEAVLAFLDEPR